MPVMTWQLWLAKDLVEEHHLPWQSSQKNLTPPKSCTVNLFTFNRERLTYYFTQNQRKVFWVENWAEKK